MSTRFVKKKNIVILGLAKNGSQALKQLAINNDEWEVIDGDFFDIKKNKWKTGVVNNIFLNKDVTLYIPIRDEWERAQSWLAEELRKEFVDIHGEEIQKDQVCQELLSEFLTNKFKNPNREFPRDDNSYKNKDEFHYFFKNIFLNEEWNGCTVKFFELKYLSNKFCKFIDQDTSSIPLYNALEASVVKMFIKDNIPTELILRKHFFKKYWLDCYDNLEKPLWDRMKSTKYWLHL